jgi:hypothetical protein
MFNQNFIFELLSDLSFGLVTDLKTVLAALVIFGFLYFGAGLIVEALHAAAAGKHFARAGQYLGLMRSDENLYGRDSAEYDYHSRMYQTYMQNSITHSFADREAAFEPEIMFTGGDIAESSEDSQGYSFDETVFNYGEFSGYGDADAGFSKLSTVKLLGGSSTASGGSFSGPSDDPGPSDDDRPHWDED